jgi:hypothetical protein
MYRNTAAKLDAPDGRRRRRLCFVMALAAALSWTGCARRPQLSTDYGRCSGNAVSSINGTSALVKLFRQSGKRVAVSRRLGNLVAKADAVIWVPDSYRLPNRKVIRFFDVWLSERPGRTVIYVAKDYDGTAAYWRQIAAQPSAQGLAVQRELARAIAAADRETARLPAEDACDWFRIERDVPQPLVVDGGRWDPLVSDLTRQRNSPAALSSVRLLPKDDEVSTSEEDPVRSDRMYTLLSAGDDVLAAEYRRNHWGDGRVLLFSSGAWFLNLPLVQPDNRVLAEQLLQECSAARRVVVLESDDEGPRIADGKQRHHALEAFTVRPFNSILLHLTVLGMVFCCAVFPIFGRPRPVDDSIRSDFRRHVIALGDLISKTGDAQYARDRRDYYWTKVRRDSGVSQLDEPHTEQPVDAPADESVTAERAAGSNAGNPFAPVSEQAAAPTAETPATDTTDAKTNQGDQQ